MGSFCPKYTRFEVEKYRGVIFHGTEQWFKIWINPDLVASKMAWGIGWTFIRALKSLKNCTLMDSFCRKHTTCFSYKILEELCVMTLKRDAKFKGKLTCGVKNDVRNFVNFHASSQKSENLHFNGLVLSNAYNILDGKVHDTEEWYKTWRKIDLRFGRWHKEFGKFSSDPSKV